MYNRKMPIKSWIFLAVGGAIGTVCRVWVMQRMQSLTASAFPWGTFVVNIVGCFLIGLLWVLAEKYQVSTPVRLFAIAGLLGGFTTFSTFGLDALLLMTQNTFFQSALYVMASVGVGFLCVKVGWVVGRWF